MPSHSVAARQNAWKRIKHRYKKHSSGWYARKEARKLAKAKAIAHRKATGRH